MDMCDYAQQHANLVLSTQISAARSGEHKLPGPNICGCGEVNDRRAEGFNTCSDCYQRAVIAVGHGS